MWQDYMARRPMEVETFLGSPIRLSQEMGMRLPRIETLYAILHNVNVVNQARPKGPDAAARPPPGSGSPTNGASPLPRLSTQSNGRPPDAQWRAQWQRHAETPPAHLVADGPAPMACGARPRP